MSENVVAIGDLMRWSVPLLEQVQAETTAGIHWAVLRVKDIRVEPDGTKTIVMERAWEESSAGVKVRP